ncbi:MAG: FtsW/RodA/SpoVE family cell cycle protein [Firmicutes bacterium]|nr:FtsW/RodA/SpoVE family cell cycle protein [Bacillota bacterium]
MSRWSWRARIDARRPERRLLWSALIPCGVLILLSRWTDGWAGWPESAKVAAGYGALFFGLHGALVVLRPRADMLLLPLVSVPCGIGLALLNRMDPLLAGRQLLALAAGGVALVAVAVAAPRAPSHIAPVLGAGAVATLLLTAALGSEAGGARAWLSVAGLRFLPVEAAKLVLVWCWGVMLSRGMSPWLVVSTAALASAGLVAQNEFGYPLILFVTAIAMIYAATGRRGWLVGSLAAAVPLGFFAGDLPHVRNRVTAWLDPWADPLGAGYQALQGMFALSEGGLFGRAIGAGFPELLPAAHTDYILASVGEELGLAGQLSVLGACGLLVARAFAIARRAPGKRERLVSAGLGVLLGLQAVWMAGGVTRLLPLSGLGMPWLSYGGSAALANLADISGRAQRAQRRGRGGRGRRRRGSIVAARRRGAAPPGAD